ncbi:DUF2178 domain-containing protein [Natronoarchaeum mannanilyticum]|uniref:DUF2178 domain-containing protein n=1 Tax=Natronoarchaeum mannanilyticum TaxID=926360 RepID=A0AAV3T9T6_9EURY
MNALFAVGIAALLVGMTIGRDLAGIVVYALAVIGGDGATVYLQFGSAVTLQDEREAELARSASNITFQLYGFLGLFAFVGLFLLDALGRPSIGPTVETLLYAYAAITLTWGAICTALRYRT